MLKRPPSVPNETFSTLLFPVSPFRKLITSAYLRVFKGGYSLIILISIDASGNLSVCDLTIFSDNFLVFSLIKDDGYFNVRYQFKPLMMWIWLSVLIMSFGGLLSLVKNKWKINRT